MRSTILVETVNKVSSAVTAQYLDRMVRREAALTGSKSKAIDKICRKYGFTHAQIKHLRGGRAKDPKASLIWRVRAAYLDFCERQIKALQHEIRIEKAKHEDADFSDFAREADVLAEKVRRAKEARF